MAIFETISAGILTLHYIYIHPYVDDGDVSDVKFWNYYYCFVFYLKE